MRKIRVVEFTNKLGFGGTEKVLYTFCKYLNRDKFDIYVCALASDGLAAREEAFRKINIETHLSSKRFFKNYLKKISPDILHIHRAGYPEPGVITAAKEAGIPIVIEHNVFGRVDNTIEHDAIDCHIFVSYSCAWRYQMWVAKPLVGSKYEILYNPVEINLFDSFGFDNRDFTRKSIGRIGRDDNEKWEANFIKALSLIYNVFPDFEFHVIGMTDEIMEKIKSMGLEKNLRLYPMTGDQGAIMEFYGNISVLTHFASMGETFGLVLAEAMAAKLPVVTHYTPPYTDSAQSELINSGCNGIVATDPEMYAKAVIALLSSPENAKQMGLDGYKKARPSYDAEIITEGLEKIFLAQLELKGIV